MIQRAGICCHQSINFLSSVSPLSCAMKSLFITFPTNIATIATGYSYERDSVMPRSCSWLGPVAAVPTTATIQQCVVTKGSFFSVMRAQNVVSRRMLLRLTMVHRLALPAVHLHPTLCPQTLQFVMNYFVSFSSNEVIILAFDDAMNLCDFYGEEEVESAHAVLSPLLLQASTEAQR